MTQHCNPTILDVRFFRSNDRRYTVLCRRCGITCGEFQRRNEAEMMAHYLEHYFTCFISPIVPDAYEYL